MAKQLPRPTNNETVANLKIDPKLLETNVKIFNEISGIRNVLEKKEERDERVQLDETTQKQANKVFRKEVQRKMSFSGQQNDSPGSQSLFNLTAGGIMRDTFRTIKDRTMNRLSNNRFVRMARYGGNVFNALRGQSPMFGNADGELNQKQLEEKRESKNQVGEIVDELKKLNENVENLEGKKTDKKDEDSFLGKLANAFLGYKIASGLITGGSALAGGTLGALGAKGVLAGATGKTLATLAAAKLAVIGTAVVTTLLDGIVTYFTESDNWTGSSFSKIVGSIVGGSGEWYGALARGAAGMYAGAKAGAAMGASIGLVSGPGAIIFTIAGALLGATLGTIVGALGGEKINNYIDELGTYIAKGWNNLIKTLFGETEKDIHHKMLMSLPKDDPRRVEYEKLLAEEAAAKTKVQDDQKNGGVPTTTVDANSGGTPVIETTLTNPEKPGVTTVVESPEKVLENTTKKVDQFRRNEGSELQLDSVNDDRPESRRIITRAAKIRNDNNLQKNAESMDEVEQDSETKISQIKVKESEGSITPVQARDQIEIVKEQKREDIKLLEQQREGLLSEQVEIVNKIQNDYDQHVGQQYVAALSQGSALQGPSLPPPAEVVKGPPIEDVNKKFKLVNIDKGIEDDYERIEQGLMNVIALQEGFDFVARQEEDEQGNLIFRKDEKTGEQVPSYVIGRGMQQLDDPVTGKKRHVKSTDSMFKLFPRLKDETVDEHKRRIQREGSKATGEYLKKDFGVLSNSEKMFDGMQRTIGENYNMINSDIRKIALSSMLYQLGLTKFLKFDDTWRLIDKANNFKDGTKEAEAAWDAVATEMGLRDDGTPAKWATQTGGRLKELQEAIRSGKVFKRDGFEVVRQAAKGHMAYEPEKIIVGDYKGIQNNPEVTMPMSDLEERVLSTVTRMVELRDVATAKNREVQSMNRELRMKNFMESAEQIAKRIQTKDDLASASKMVSMPPIINSPVDNSKITTNNQSVIINRSVENRHNPFLMLT